MRIFVSSPTLRWRRLGLAAVASILIHLSLFAVGLLFPGFEPRVFVRRGEPLFIELPTLEEEPAPRGNPAVPRGRQAPPPARPTPKPRRPAREPVPKAKPAPKVEVARPAPKAAPPAPSPEPEAPQVAKAMPPPEPEPVIPELVAPPEPAEREAALQFEPGSVIQPRAALPTPLAEFPSNLGQGWERPGGGGGLLGGRGGIEGEPIPLNTTNPRYTDYFEKIRRRIKANWIYPREAGDRGIGGQLQINFTIRKDGGLQVVDLRRSSGIAILDLYALNAVKLAQPFPPVPSSVAKGPLRIAGLFTYQVVDARLLNQYLR